MAEESAVEVLHKLQPIFQEALGQPDLQVGMESSSLNTRNWDSLAHIEIIEMAELEFGVRFALGELQSLKQVGDLVELILAKKR